MIYLGKTELKKGIMLAPMAGYTDRAMRLVCHGQGAEYSVSEMVSAKAVVFKDKKTARLAYIGEDEGPVAIQIFGSEPDIMAEAARTLSAPSCGAKPAAIDINMGCPVNKIFSNGEGSALMRSPELIGRIVGAVKRAVNIPVTVKLRAGVDGERINAVDCALSAEAAGADLVCIHGRTRTQMYGGKADLKIIENVKSHLHIPVIGNGDIRCGEDAMRMINYTGCDGIAVGRGAVGNPFIFREIDAALDGKDFTPPTLDERREMALYQLRLAIADKGEAVAVNEARKQIALYFGGFRGAAALRGGINSATTLAEVEALLMNIED